MPVLPTVLLTRPEPDSRRFAARAAGTPGLAGLPVLIAPLMRIDPVPHDAAALAGAEGLVFTSAHAVPFAGPGAGRLALCVGGHTAAAARDAGFRVIEGPGDAEGLAPIVAAHSMPLLHPRGRHVARDLGVPHVTVYDQVELPPTEAALALLAGDRPVILPLFSPRSARIAAAMARGARAPVWVVPISPAAAAAWDAPAARVAPAATPDAAGILAALRRLAPREPS